MGLGLVRGQGEGSLGVVGDLGVRISEWGERALEVGVCGVGGQGSKGGRVRGKEVGGLAVGDKGW